MSPNKTLLHPLVLCVVCTAANAWAGCKDDESALGFCDDMARTLGIDQAFAPDPLTLNRPERVWEKSYLW